MRATWIALLAACVSLAATPDALPERIVSKALVCQLESGYGVVEGEVVTASSVSKPGEYPQHIDVIFTIRMVVAQPTQGTPFVLKAGDQITIRVSAGYACQIEDDPSQDFATGKRYYLIVKHLHGNAYAHCNGASAMWRVERFTNADRQFVNSVREMTAVPEPRRLQRLVETVGDPKATDRLRVQAYAGLSDRLWRSRLAPADREKTTLALLKIWKEPHSNLSLSLMYDLDCLLQGYDPSFTNSADRADVWLAHLFAPTPDNLQGDNNRDNLTMEVVRELIAARPADVGHEVINQMLNRIWPAPFRRSLSAALLYNYEHLEQPEPQWDRDLRAYYALELGTSDTWMLRLLSGDLQSSCAQPSHGVVRRRFVPGVEIHQKLKDALARMKVEAGRANADPYAQAAVSDLSNAIKALENTTAQPVPG